MKNCVFFSEKTVLQGLTKARPCDILIQINFEGGIRNVEHVC